MATMLIIILVLIIVIILVAIAITLCCVLKEKHTDGENKVRDYGACEESDSVPFKIKVTEPDEEKPIKACCKHHNHDARRCTMPCILPSCRHHSINNGESQDGLLDDQSSLSSSFLSNFISPARRYSDNQITDIVGDLRKNSFRPDRFSITSLNLDPWAGSNSELGSYELLNLYGHGKLCFSVNFNESISRLYVTVNKAVYLNRTKMRNLGGFYVKVYLISGDTNTVLQMHKSEIVTANKNPMFEQTFTYTLSRPALVNVNLKFVVKEARSNVTKNEFVGGFVFSLNNEDIIVHPEWFQELWRDLKGDLKLVENLGEVLISLKYSTESTSSITVNVQRARNLQIRPHDTSVFARCTMLMGNTAVKTKRSVTIKTDISFPYLDHECLFRMQNLAIMETGIAVHICSRSKIGFSHLLGKVMLGSVIYTDDESSTTHWHDMINYSDRSVTKWHKIV